MDSDLENFFNCYQSIRHCQGDLCKPRDFITLQDI